jgi:hypothetical protein
MGWWLRRSVLKAARSGAGTDQGGASRVTGRKRVLVVGKGTPLLTGLALSLVNNRSGDVLLAANHPAAMALVEEFRPEIALIGASSMVHGGNNLKDAIALISPSTRVIIAKE